MLMSGYCAGAARNLVQYLDDQADATGVLPDDRTIVVIQSDDGDSTEMDNVVANRRLVGEEHLVGSHRHHATPEMLRALAGR